MEKFDFRDMLGGADAKLGMEELTPEQELAVDKAGASLAATMALLSIAHRVAPVWLLGELMARYVGAIHHNAGVEHARNRVEALQGCLDGIAAGIEDVEAVRRAR